MGGIFNHINANLYHYAGNSPVKYTDPDGRKVVNKTNEYILVATEHDKFVVLPPNSTYTGENVANNNLVNINNLKNPIDGGKVDGVILSSGDVIKISDDDKLKWWNVDLSIVEFDISVFGCSYNVKVGYLPNIKSVLGNLACNIAKPILRGRFDFSGHKKIGKNNDWLPRALSQEELKDLSKSPNGTVYSKKYIENKIKEWDSENE